MSISLGSTIHSMPASLKAPILVSRSSLQHLANKYPNYLKPIIKPIRKEPETPWGPKFKLFAYSCAAIAVPYSIGVAISASSSLRDYLEGDGDPSNDTLGRRVVAFVRWYWGEEDAIPYSEYLEKQMLPFSDIQNNENGTKSNKKADEISLQGELSASDRQTELDIQQQIHDTYNIHIYHDDSETDLIVPGTVLYQQQIDEIQKVKDPDISRNDRIWINFHDPQGNTDKESNISDNQELNTTDVLPFQSSIVSDSISTLTNVFSAWHYFDKSNDMTSSNANKTSKTTSSVDDEFESQIKLIRDRIQQLNSELNNPATLRAYDDIVDEIVSMKQEEKQLRRERRIQKWKNLFFIRG
jgi:hypothetical protein